MAAEDEARYLHFRSRGTHDKLRIEGKETKMKINKTALKKLG